VSLDFQQMNLPEPIMQALETMKFQQPTSIQAAAIPLVREGRDLIGCAQTGTGKTAAFCIPIIAKILENPEATALILSPTRELALQTGEVLRQLTEKTPHIRGALLIGGVDVYRQIRDLSRKPQIIVATPGRLSDLVRRKSANLKNLSILVLDEGDRMLDMGFEPQINEILGFIPAERQTLLFSATMPDRIQKLIKKYMKNPARVSVGTESKPVKQIKHSVIETSKAAKKDIILDILNAREGSVLIFVNTKHGTDRLANHLHDFGYKVTKIHGGRSQGQRNQSLQGFRGGKFRIMVATDVAARGLDVPHIAHVINFDLPMDQEDYLHRIGRTARAGAEGEAICLLSPEDKGMWRRIARTYGLDAGVVTEKTTRREKARRDQAIGINQPGDVKAFHEKQRKFKGREFVEEIKQKVNTSRDDRKERERSHGRFEDQASIRSKFAKSPRHSESSERFDAVEADFAERSFDRSAKKSGSDKPFPKNFERFAKKPFKSAPRQDRDEAPRRDYSSRSEYSHSAPGADRGHSAKQGFGTGPKRDFASRKDFGPKRDFGSESKRDFGSGQKRDFGSRPKRDFGSAATREFAPRGDRDPSVKREFSQKRDYGASPKKKFGTREEYINESRGKKARLEARGEKPVSRETRSDGKKRTPAWLNRKKKPGSRFPSRTA
jgi:ATP-dependent RNA helicase DeaD